MGQGVCWGRWAGSRGAGPTAGCVVVRGGQCERSPSPLLSLLPPKVVPEAA
jgi:hypothetical protein